MAAEFEWVIETMDGPDDDADIVAVNHETTYADAKSFAMGIEHVRIGLVRDAENKRYGGYDRSWAYIDEEGLPERFSDANGNDTVKVPAKYRKQYERSSS